MLQPEDSVLAECGVLFCKLRNDPEGSV